VKQLNPNSRAVATAAAIKDFATTRYTLGEEIANSITHGIGVVAAIAGLAVLTAFAVLYGDAWHVVSVSIYGATLVLLYSASTLYHAITHTKAKKILRILDHTAIFFLIAGTYTPFLLVNLRGAWGWSLFAVIWTLTLLGTLIKVTPLRRFEKTSLALFLIMGWAMLVAIKPLMANVADGGLILLVAGGLAYSLGVIFYVWEHLPYSHAIWHGFVLCGSVLHYFAVLFYVVPLSPSAAKLAAVIGIH